MDLVIFRMRKNKKINKPEGFYVKALSKKNGILLIVIILIFLLLTGRLGYIQFVKGAEYKKAAYMNQTINKIISPKRGIIYDSTGKVLATSADVDTITINPGSITYKGGKDVEPEKLANAFVDGDWIESPDISDMGIRYLTTGNVGDGIFKRQGNGCITAETFTKYIIKNVEARSIGF